MAHDMPCVIEKIVMTKVSRRIQSRKNDSIYRNVYISATTVSMAITLGRMLTYIEELSPIKSHDPLTTWSCEFI